MSAATTLSLEKLLASDQVPSLPEVAVRIIQIAQEEDPDTQELIAAIRTDPAIAGRVLKFANSALFGLRTRASSIDAAVPMLGMTLVRTLVLGFSLAEQSNPSASLKPWYRRLWKETLFQASAAEYMGEQNTASDAPTWFLGGLLQDIGQLAMLSVYEDQYVTNVLDVDSSSSRVGREVDHFGFSHADVSAALCRRWNLEDSLADAIASHHLLVPDSEMDGSDLRVGLTAAACCSEYMDAVTDRLSVARTDVERFLIEAFNILPCDIYQVLAEIDVRTLELAGCFSLDVGKLPPRERILARAQSVLCQISMNGNLETVAGRTVPPANLGSDSSHTGEDEFLDRNEWQAWLDEQSDVYNAKYLESALPIELSKAHTQNQTVGLLMIELPTVTEDVRSAPERSADLVKAAVRPTDHVVRYDDSTFLVILPSLNVDLLHRIAVRIQDDLSEYFDVSSDEADAPCIGGVVAVPAARKASSPDTVLNALKASTVDAHKVSRRVAFQAIVGRKVRPLVPGVNPQ
ncbi:MAG: HDOD domain-containing protein [Fuerstiella sp.]|jgi:HD-like signal output (HDOD) protein/GGDEF domain-containing protein|nr:HDOD domain-containing protein [Fuerstiella sp.]